MLFSIKNAICFFQMAFAATLIAAENHQIILSLDKPGGIYKKAENALVSAEYRVNGKPADGLLRAEIIDPIGSRKTIDFPASQKRISVPMTGNAVRIVVSAIGPDGKIIHTREGKKLKKVSASIGMAADPHEIQPGLKEPEDFQSFWDNTVAELAKIPIKVKRTEVETAAHARGKFKCWDIQVDCIDGVPVSGYLTMPANAAPKSLPVMVEFQGAGVFSSWKTYMDGAIHLCINAHGLPNGRPKEFYAKLAGTKLLRYQRRNSDDRDRYYFRNVFLRVQRALEYVRTLPEYDGKTLIVYGHSQGGAQAIFAAGMNPDVSMIFACMPAMCDHGGILAGRKSGWPQLVGMRNGRPTSPKIAKTLAYYDMAFFARRIKGEAYFIVGLLDATCCPTSVFAAFNCIPGKKNMTVLPDTDHDGRMLSLLMIKNFKKR